METLKYPIGRFRFPENNSADLINENIAIIGSFPKQIKNLTKDLSKKQLNWIYRPEGWNIKQVVHHCADSHMNFLIRVKWTLTEDTPTIKAYHEDRWAKLKISNRDNISDSLKMIKLVHKQLAIILNDLDADDFDRAFLHPENGKLFSLKNTIALYSWHGRHHLAHIRQALEHHGNFENAE